MHPPFILPLLISWALISQVDAVGVETAQLDADAIVRAANSWQAGQELPSELLTYRDSHDCFSIDTDTVPLFSEITSYPLLLEVVLSTTTEQRVWDVAVERTLYLAGPTRFFSSVLPAIASSPSLQAHRRFRSLRKRGSWRHVVVDGISVSPKDFPPGEAERVLEAIRSALQAGESFEAVRARYAKDYEYYPDGAACPRTRICNLGDVIISGSRATARPFRYYDLPSRHVKPLSRSLLGEVLILRDSVEQSLNLYRIREVYAGHV